MSSFFQRMYQSDRLSVIFLMSISLVFFIGLGAFHLFDWDEINFAESAREMMVSGDYLHVQINFEPFWEKPPLFFWLQVVSMMIFGVGEFAARFPNALFGALYLLTFYLIGKRHFDRKFGIVWALIFFASLLPHIYFKSGIIDPVFNYFIFLSIYFMLRVIGKDGERIAFLAIMSGVFSGLSVITKGPVGFLLLGLTLLIYLLIKRFKPFPKISHILLFFTGLLGVVCFWLFLEYYQNGYDMLLKFLRYQIELFNSPVAGHEQPFYYHFVIVLFGCFPMSFFAIPLLFKSKDKLPLELDSWMRILFWVVLLLFSIVTTKIIHYSSMTYIPLSFLSAYTIYRKMNLREPLPKWLNITLVLVGTFIGVAIATVIYIFSHKDSFMYLFKDTFTRDAMRLNVQWSGFEFLIGLLFIVGVVAGVIFLHRKRFLPAVSSFASGTALTLLLLQFIVLPKIERHTQGPLIEICKELGSKDVYLETYGFKSYANYFYGKVDPMPKEHKDLSWLMRGDIDKPVFLVTKSANRDLDNDPNFQFVKQRGGYRLYVRNVE